MTQETIKEESSPIKGAVVYTDGSCKYTNPGHIGWGAHGYIYQLIEPKKPIVVDEHILTNHGYQNPSLKKNMVEPGILVDPIEYIDFLGSSLQIGTNNQAEIQAVYHTLNRLDQLDLKYINVYSDSEYVLKGLEDHCKVWEYHHWRKPDGSFVPNHEWWIKLYDMVRLIKSKGVTLELKWVKGHVNVGNIRADILAGIGTNHSMDGVEITSLNTYPAKSYWSREIDRHPMLNFKRIYFNSIRQYNYLGNYFQADSGAADNLIGKRIPETGLSVVRLRDPDKVIEAVKERQYHAAKDINAIVMVKLDRVFSKEIYPYLNEYGKYSLLTAKNTLNLSFFDKKTVTEEVNPTGLSLRAIDSLTFLEDLMDRFIRYQEIGFDQAENNILLNFHDITQHFFDINTKTVKDQVIKQHTLKPEMVVGRRDVLIEVQEKHQDTKVPVKVPLILGIDLLPRNNMKKLEDHSPIVYLLTWRESQTSLRYAVFIQSEIGQGIWSNYYSDRIFLSQPKQTT